MTNLSNILSLDYCYTHPTLLGGKWNSYTNKSEIITNYTIRQKKLGKINKNLKEKALRIYDSKRKRDNTCMSNSSKS